MLTIGRLGTLGDIEPKTLRYYDRVGLVRPTTRTPAGYRVYGEDAVERLGFIRRAKALGMSLADIRRILAVRDEGAPPCQHVLTVVGQNIAKVQDQDPMGPVGVALDATGILYVANWGANSTNVYAPSASGNVAPLRTIRGALTGRNHPGLIFLRHP